MHSPLPCILLWKSLLCCTNSRDPQAITLHTFFVIFFRWTPGPHSVWIYRIVIPFIWTYLILFVVIGYSAHRGDNLADPRVFFVRPLPSTSLHPFPLVSPFQSPTPYWCWIGSGFDVERIVGEYLWLWTALLSSIFFYTLLFFRLRGNIHVDPQNWKRIRIRLQPSSHFPSDTPSFLDAPSAAAYREAMAMIWYPICYTILVLPLSIVRWRTFRTPAHLNLQTPFAVTAVVVTIFGLSGVANVVLITLTRRNLLLFGQRRGVVSTQESMNLNEGGFGSGSALALRSGMFCQGGTGERLPMTSVCSTMLPGISLDCNGGLHDVKSIPVGCSNWGSTTTHLAPSIGVRSVVSMGDLSEPMKFGATPSPALPPAVYSGSNGHRKPLSDPELGKKTSESSIRALMFPEERDWGRELNNSRKGDRTSARAVQSGSPEPEVFGRTRNDSLSGPAIPPGLTTPTGQGLGPSTREQVLRWSTNESRSLIDQEERSHKPLHPLDSTPLLRYPPSYSSSQLPLVRPSIPPVPTGSPPRPLSSRGRGVTDSNAGGSIVRAGVISGHCVIELAAFDRVCPAEE